MATTSSTLAGNNGISTQHGLETKSDKKLALLSQTRKVILEQLTQHSIDPERLTQAQSSVEGALDFLMDSSDTLDLLIALNQCSDALFKHSVCVSLYSNLIAQELGWTSAPTMTRVVLAGILHEIGYKDIDAYLLNKSRDQMTLDEINTVDSHPARGAKVISSVSRIPSEIAQIVSQHRDRSSRRNTHPLAEVIGVAAEFCEIAVQRPGLPPVSTSEALQKLAQRYEGNLPDSEVFEALTTILT